MFDLIESRRQPQYSARKAFWTAILAAFALGLGIGKLMAGAKPVDWFLGIVILLVVAFQAIVWSVRAHRMLTQK